jgi:hypothetical protein
LCSGFQAHDYAYGPAGNRVQKVVTLDGVQDSSLTYTYNCGGQKINLLQIIPDIR